MSYRFMMFRASGAVRTPNDLSEDTTDFHQPGNELQDALARLYPRTQWHRSDEQRLIFGSLDGEDGWYEFVLYQDPSKSFSINTSPDAETRRLIPEICTALGLVAFDSQAYVLIGAAER
ncbi:MAG: hypothetical protein ACREFB_00095 [Stellaceae bacterium]